MLVAAVVNRVLSADVIQSFVVTDRPLAVTGNAPRCGVGDDFGGRSSGGGDLGGGGGGGDRGGS